MGRALRSHKFYVPLITVAVSAGLFLIYYFFYVDRQRSYANERAFRLLAVLDDQLGNRFNNLENIFRAAMMDSEPKEYLKKSTEREISDIQNNCDGNCYGKREGDFTLSLDSAHISLSARFKPEKHNCFLSASLKLDKETRKRFDKVTQDYFDDILIATSSGEVLFQKNVDGLRIANVNGLLPAKAPASSGESDKADGDKKKPSLLKGRKTSEIQLAGEFTNVKDVELAGAKYKLYLQPSSVNVLDSEADTKAKLLLCGLWRADRLQSEAVSIPYPVLIWGTLVLLAAFALLWPLLKVAYMSPVERLKRRHVFYLLLSALLGTTLFTVIVLNASYALRADEESEEQLRYLANQIDQNIKSEMARSLAFLDLLARTETEYIRPGEYHAKVNFRGADLPNFDYVIWTDAEGRQLYKLTVKPEATPPISLHDSEYFEDVSLGRRLMKPVDQGGLFRAVPVHDELRISNEHNFRFDVAYSRNTGEFFTVVARPYQPAGAAFPGEPAAQVMFGKFRSLVQPVVPEGFGFALVAHDGTVQVHSIAARSKIENFFKECHQDPTLKALVQSPGSDYLKLDYMGRRQHMFVKPLRYLAEPAPALVVFRDLDYYGTINVACLLVFAMLAGMFSIPFVVGLAICVFRRRDYPLEKLWPSRGAMVKYLEILVANLSLTLAFALRFSKLKMNLALFDILLMIGVTALLCLAPRQRGWKWVEFPKILVLAAIVAIAGLSWTLLVAVAYVFLLSPKVFTAIRERIARRLSLKYAYLGTVLSLLIVVVVLPCFGLFRISYNTVNRLALQNAQLARRDQLIHRVDARKTNPVSPAPIANAQKDLDRYDKAVFLPKDMAAEDLQAKKQSKVAPDVSLLEWPIAVASRHFPSNRLGAELRVMALAQHTGAPLEWGSTQDDDDELLWLTNPGNIADAELLGVYPLWQTRSEAELLMLPLGIVLALWLLYLIRRVFLVDLEDLPQLKAWSPSKTGARNLLIIGELDAGKETLLVAAPDADVLDLEEVAAGNWTLPPLLAPVTRVVHFEFDLDNPDTSFRKLKLLEHLRYEQNKRLVLLSAVDPMFFLAASQARPANSNGSGSMPAGQFLDRWANVFHGFERLRMPDASEQSFEQVLAHQKKNGTRALIDMIEGECRYTPQLRTLGVGMLLSHRNEGPISKGQFLEMLLEHAGDHYGELWSACTTEERLVLYQLASDGWVNPKNEQAIRQLQQRGLIRRNSGFRLMNDSLARFVRNADRTEDIAKWEDEQEHSGWSAMKLALGTGLMMFGAWLLYAQQDVFQLGIGYLTALGSASGAVLSLTRTLRGKGAVEVSG